MTVQNRTWSTDQLLEFLRENRTDGPWSRLADSIAATQLSNDELRVCIKSICDLIQKQADTVKAPFGSPQGRKKRRFSANVHDNELLSEKEEFELRLLIYQFSAIVCLLSGMIERGTVYYRLNNTMKCTRDLTDFNIDLDTGLQIRQVSRLFTGNGSLPHDLSSVLDKLDISKFMSSLDAVAVCKLITGVLQLPNRGKLPEKEVIVRHCTDLTANIKKMYSSLQRNYEEMSWNHPQAVVRVATALTTHENCELLVATVDTIRLAYENCYKAWTNRIDTLLCLHSSTSEESALLEQINAELERAVSGPCTMAQANPAPHGSPLGSGPDFCMTAERSGGSLNPFGTSVQGAYASAQSTPFRRFFTPMGAMEAKNNECEYYLRLMSHYTQVQSRFALLIAVPPNHLSLDMQESLTKVELNGLYSIVCALKIVHPAQESIGRFGENCGRRILELRSIISTTERDASDMRRSLGEDNDSRVSAKRAASRPSSTSSPSNRVSPPKKTPIRGYSIPCSFPAEAQNEVLETETSREASTVTSAVGTENVGGSVLQEELRTKTGGIVIGRVKETSAEQFGSCADGGVSTEIPVQTETEVRTEQDELNERKDKLNKKIEHIMPTIEYFISVERSSKNFKSDRGTACYILGCPYNELNKIVLKKLKHKVQASLHSDRYHAALLDKDRRSEFLDQLNDAFRIVTWALSEAGNLIERKGRANPIAPTKKPPYAEELGFPDSWYSRRPSVMHGSIPMHRPSVDFRAKSFLSAEYISTDRTAVLESSGAFERLMTHIRSNCPLTEMLTRVENAPTSLNFKDELLHGVVLRPLLPGESRTLHVWILCQKTSNQGQTSLLTIRNRIIQHYKFILPVHPADYISSIDLKDLVCIGGDRVCRYELIWCEEVNSNAFSNYYITTANVYIPCLNKWTVGQLRASVKSLCELAETSPMYAAPMRAICGKFKSGTATLRKSDAIEFLKAVQQIFIK